MINLKNENGITLVVLIITIVVLLILVGISLVIANNLLIDKAISASNQTVEDSIQEKVGIAWNECEIDYWSNKRDDSSLEKENYFKTNFAKYLENNNEFKNITITGNINETAYIGLKYKNKDYTMMLSSTGKCNILYPLKGNVTVGDYIEYDIEYADVYSGERYTAQNGWIVIDDGKSKGTSGSVRIMSVGIPAKWTYDKEDYEKVDDAIAKLTTNFENLELKDIEGNIIPGSCFKNELAQDVMTLSLSDFNHVYNLMHGTHRKADDISPVIEENIALGIKEPERFYWLSTNDEDNMYYVTNDGIKSKSHLKVGVKPVILLKDDLKVIYENNIWKIKN